MNSKTVKLLAFSALIFAILSATPMLMASTHPAMKTGNLTRKPSTEIQSNAELTGDPVGGGIPNVQIIPLGDPVGGGIPNVQIIAD
jgi:hypothetical protein